MWLLVAWWTCHRWTNSPLLGCSSTIVLLFLGWLVAIYYSYIKLVFDLKFWVHLHLNRVSTVVGCAGRLLQPANRKQQPNTTTTGQVSRSNCSYTSGNCQWIAIINRLLRFFDCCRDKLLFPIIDMIKPSSLSIISHPSTGWNQPANPRSFAIIIHHQ